MKKQNLPFPCAFTQLQACLLTDHLLHGAVQQVGVEAMHGNENTIGFYGNYIMVINN
jgi:hypothetical protein